MNEIGKEKRKENKMESDRGRCPMTWCSHVQANTFTYINTQT